MSGFIYLIGAGEVNAVKIGFTKSNPEYRVRALQTGSPCALDLMAYWRGTIEEEQRLHRIFEPVSLHGEWFAIDGKLSDFLWYMIDAIPGKERFRQRETFDNAVHDVILATGAPHPSVDEVAYLQSANVGAFGVLFS